RRYGTHCRDVAEYVERDPELARPVVAGEPELQAEFAYQRDHEMARYPADHLLRRTRLGLFRPELLRLPPTPVAAGVVQSGEGGGEAEGRPGDAADRLPAALGAGCERPDLPAGRP